jgi:flagellar hook-length control protein FliK
MSNIGVNSLEGLFSNQMPAKASVKTTENFDETLKNVNQKDSKLEVKTDKSEVNETEDNSKDTISKFESSKKREVVKKQEEPTDEQIAAAMEEVVSQVKEFIQERFNISEEDLNNMMVDLDITDNQLLDVNALTKLVMKLDGIEKPMDMLTSPNFNDDLKELLNQVDQIKNEVFDNIKLPELTPKTEAEEVVLETTDVNENLENIENEDVNVEKDETLEVETEENQVETEEKPVVENTNVSEGNMTGTTAEDNGNSQTEHKDNKTQEISTDESVNINAIRPEDFAARLTEDLSAKVGERQAITIVRQVVEQISMQTKQGMTTMELQLYPAHLGRVVVQLVSKDGHLSAQISAETEAAKNALESQLTLLKENLVNQGVRIEDVEVTIASHAFEQNMQGERRNEEQSGSKNRGRRAVVELGEGMAAEVDDTPEIMEVMGNTVSYSA